MKALRNFVLATPLLALAACGSNNYLENQMVSFEKTVSERKIGQDTDQWIEMQNIAGEWERVGLIFGYLGDYNECLNAISGLKKVNFSREYRCVPAQKI